jgi:hypothetical protein
MYPLYYITYLATSARLIKSGRKAIYYRMVSENRLLELCMIADVESGSARSLLCKCCLVKFRLLPVQRIHAQTKLAIERIYMIRSLGTVFKHYCLLCYSRVQNWLRSLSPKKL